MATGIGLVLILVFSTYTPITADKESHTTNCPEGWIQHGLACYRYNATPSIWDDAASECSQYDGHLVYIEDAEEDSIVKGFVVSDAMWLGARRVNLEDFDEGDRWLYYSHSRQGSSSIWIWTPSSDLALAKFTESYNLNDGRRLAFVTNDETSDGDDDDKGSKTCGVMQQDGVWSGRPCQQTLPFLCEKPPPCEVGYYNAHETLCSEVCHCHNGQPCDQRSGICAKGCEEGWTGSSCDIPNETPEATYNCLRTADNGLRADLTVDAKRRSYHKMHLVDNEGRPLPCDLSHWVEDSRKNFRVANWYHVSLMYPGAFDKISTNNTTSNTNSNTNTTSNMTHSSVSLDAANPSNTTADDDDINATGDVTGAPRKRDDATGSGQGHDACTASETEDGTVTWLVEFKQYDGILTGDDVTVEVTCRLDEADELETTELIVDDSEPEDPLKVSRAPLQVNAYFVDAHTSARHETFHLGQSLRLLVHIQGLIGEEKAFPISCFVTPKDGNGKKYYLVDAHGNGVEGSPVTKMTPDPYGRLFTSNAFPAFSLGSEAVVLSCEVYVRWGK